MSTPSFLNFEMSSSIVQLTSAFVYLRFTETYYTNKISATEIVDFDMVVAGIILSVQVYLVIHLMVKS